MKTPKVSALSALLMTGAAQAIEGPSVLGSLAPDLGEAMDPNLFALNWDVVFEVLITITLLAFLLERALAVLFESTTFLRIEHRRKQQGLGSTKPLIAFLVAALGCVLWQFDAMSIILHHSHVTVLGSAITGAVIAGGSKASLKLFHDVLGVYSSTYGKIREERKMGESGTADQLVERREQAAASSRRSREKGDAQ